MKKPRFPQLLWVLCCSATALAAGLVRALPAERSAYGTLHIVSKRPATASLYLDGQMLAGSESKLAPGAHQLVAVAPGFYGQARTLDVGAGTQREINIVLEPTSLPSPVAVDRFLVLADSESISAADVQGMPDHTLRVALRAKLLNQEHNTYALQELQRDVAALIDHGDIRGTVTAFLVDAIVSGKLAQSGFTDRLLVASEQNDPMASFFYAMALREVLRNAGETSPSSPRFARYCEVLRRARAQGWQAVATPWLQRDNCPG
jgi:hypothetical protein